MLPSVRANGLLPKRDDKHDHDLPPVLWTTMQFKRARYYSTPRVAFGDGSPAFQVVYAGRVRKPWEVKVHHRRGCLGLEKPLDHWLISYVLFFPCDQQRKPINKYDQSKMKKQAPPMDFEKIFKEPPTEQLKERARKKYIKCYDVNNNEVKKKEPDSKGCALQAPPPPEAPTTPFHRIKQPLGRALQAGRRQTD